MFYSLFIFAIVLAISLISTSLLISKFIPILKESGFIGKDMNKKKKPNVAELGGISIFIGFGIPI